MRRLVSQEPGGIDSPTKTKFALIDWSASRIDPNKIQNWWNPQTPKTYGIFFTSIQNHRKTFNYIPNWRNRFNSNLEEYRYYRFTQNPNLTEYRIHIQSKNGGIDSPILYIYTVQSSIGGIFNYNI
jgi:hypothetical protein